LIRLSPAEWQLKVNSDNVKAHVVSGNTRKISVPANGATQGTDLNEAVVWNVQADISRNRSC